MGDHPDPSPRVVALYNHLTWRRARKPFKYLPPSDCDRELGACKIRSLSYRLPERPYLKIQYFRCFVDAERGSGACGAVNGDRIDGLKKVIAEVSRSTSS